MGECALPTVRRTRAAYSAWAPDGRHRAGALRLSVIDGRLHVDQGRERLFPANSARQHRARRRAARSRRSRYAQGVRVAGEHGAADGAVPSSRARASPTQCDPRLEWSGGLSSRRRACDRAKFQGRRSVLCVWLQWLRVSDRSGRGRNARRADRLRAHANPARHILDRPIRCDACHCFSYSHRTRRLTDHAHQGPSSLLGDEFPGRRVPVRQTRLGQDGCYGIGLFTWQTQGCSTTKHFGPGRTLARRSNGGAGGAASPSPSANSQVMGGINAKPGATYEYIRHPRRN
ncbi:hypothetical protein BN2475_700018 [Paraburkholderia ribeironis]|uniref:Uncharacterized protein n=1 Tax=Paraburkholderia ribeironis TaxID=1247936 RepID=A0A1N7SHF2_9BURK|nr:hypothetical protein BN2475_700018 [Paraburkholderia ribeironis]